MNLTTKERAAYHLSTQAKEIAEMSKRKKPFKTTLAGMELLVYPKVYPGGIDSEIMCAVIRTPKGKTVLDLCTGTGVIALKAAQKGATKVIGVDLNPEAVKNAQANKKRLGLRSVTFQEGSLFKPVLDQKFDIITINPPYTSKRPSNKTEICFWDEDNQTTRQFFSDYKQYLNPGGKAYLAWADFSSLKLIEELAKQNDVSLRVAASKATRSGLATFLVYELI